MSVYMEGGSSLSVGAKSQLTSSGGMRQTFGGSINEDHLDEAALGGGVQAKGQSQQASVLGQQAALQQLARNQGAGKTPLANNPQASETGARPVGDLSQELLVRPATDLLETLKSFADIDRLLAINSGDTPEEQAKKKQISARWQQLTEAEQAEAKHHYQEALEAKRQEEAKKEEQKRQEKEAQEDTLLVPKGRQTGFQGFAGMTGSKKAQTILQRQRSTLGGAE